MALSATIYKLKLTIADLDRAYYDDFSLTLACHPSETEARMMVRVWAFVQQADQELEFTRGLSTDDEPDLWQKNLDGTIERWIEVGLPDADRLRKASRIAKSVIVYAYGERTAPIWWQKQGADIQALPNVQVYFLPPDSVDALNRFAQRNMSLNATLQEGATLLASDTLSSHLEQECWKDV